MRKISNRRRGDFVVEHLGSLLLIVGSILVLVIIAVLFSFVYTSITKKESCVLTVELASATKGILKPNCELKRITVTKQDVDDTSAKTTMDAYAADYGVRWPPEYSDFRRYNLDKKVAEQMKYSWSIVGQGSREYFPAWWQYFRCNADGQPSPSGTVDCSEKPDESNGLWTFFEQLGNHPGSVNMCMILSRIKFDPEVKDEFTGDMQTLWSWMDNNPIDTITRSSINPGSLMSYTEYLKTGNEGFSDEGELLGDPLTYTTDKPYVIVYVEVKPHLVDRVWQTPLEWIHFREENAEAPLNTLQLVPLDKITENCDFVIGYPG